jgi:hypothetical protein
MLRNSVAQRATEHTQAASTPAGLAANQGRGLRHIACYAMVGSQRISVEHLEAFRAAWRVTVLAISLLAVAHLLGSIGNSDIDGEALGPMLVALVSSGGGGA